MLTVAMNSVLLPVFLQTWVRVRHLLGVYCDRAAIYETLEAINAIRPDHCDTEGKILKIAETWRPWHSYATVVLWNYCNIYQ